MGTMSDPRFVIADSSGIISLLFPTDANHAAAVAASERLASSGIVLLVPSHVFVETINVVGKKQSHAAAVQVAQALYRPPTQIVEVSAQTLRNALVRFATQPESVSFTDCIVMAVADEYGTTDIFGFDRAFRTGGYRILT